jgi:hypothetical protein
LDLCAQRINFKYLYSGRSALPLDESAAAGKSACGSVCYLRTSTSRFLKIPGNQINLRAAWRAAPRHIYNTRPSSGGDQSQLRRSMLFVLLVTIKCRAIQQQITIRFIPPAIVRRNWRRAAQQPWCCFLLSLAGAKHSCYMEKAVGTNILSPCGPLK